MQITPPPPGSRVQELGDRLIVQFRPRRRGLVFLLVWLTIWSAVGSGMLDARESGESGRGFLTLWLCGWAAGECLVVFIIAWLLWGRALLIATPDRVEVRRELGRFARSKVYPVEFVRDVRAARVPHDEDEKPRDDYCLKIVCRDETIHFGEGMDEHEAEDVASATRAWIRAHALWVEVDRGDPYRARGQGERPATQGLAGFALKSLLFPAIIVAILAHLAYDTWLADRPSADAAAGADGYAAAATVRALGESGIRAEGGVRCNATSRTQWSCSVPARATTGRDAGVLLTYHCSQGSPDVIHCWTDPTRITTVASP